MSNLSPTSQPGFFRVYLEQVAETDLTAAFTNQSKKIKELFSSISEEQSTFAYAAGKWTLKEVLQHLVDAERIFTYRALCFARQETAVLPSFEENDYAAASNANGRTWEDLTTEFLTVRQSTLFLYKSFTPGMLASIGKASNNALSVNEIGFLIVGHFNHHLRIIKERYLIDIDT
ncbi:MAG: DinB family protein [Ferruginibacter sp.]